MLSKTSRQVDRTKIGFFLSIVPLSFFIASCSDSDLEAAKEFGETSDNLNQLNINVTNDIYGSCARSSAWLASEDPESRRRMQEQLNVCDNIFRPNSVQAQIAGSLLVEYVSAIGAVATEDRELVDTRLEEIGKALGNLSIETDSADGQPFKLDQNTIDAGVGIASFITNAILRDFRRDNLRAAILCTDPYIQEYTEDLSSFIEEMYVKALLDDEIDSVNINSNNYPSPLTNRNIAEDDMFVSDFPEVYTSLQNTQRDRDQQLRDEMAKIVERKDVGSSYVTLIRSTAAAHADLKRIFNDGEDILPAEVQAECDQYFSDASNGITSSSIMESDTLNQEITLSELNQIRDVYHSYIGEVNSILENTL